MINKKIKKLLDILDNTLTVILIILLSINLAIYGLNKVALNFMGG